MRFQIPQFIDVEDKVVGPFTLRQLMMVVGAAGVSVLGFTILPFFAALVVTVVSGAMGLSFALLKYNGQPLSKVAASAFLFYWNPRLFLWKREVKQRAIEVPETKVVAAPEPARPAIPVEVVLEQRKNLKEFTAQMPSIKRLAVEMDTKKEPIPQREKVLPPMVDAQKFGLFRRSTGEHEVAKRVDFR